MGIRKELYRTILNCTFGLRYKVKFIYDNEFSYDAEKGIVRLKWNEGDNIDREAFYWHYLTIHRGKECDIALLSALHEIGYLIYEGFFDENDDDELNYFERDEEYYATEWAKEQIEKGGILLNFLEKIAK